MTAEPRRAYPAGRPYRTWFRQRVVGGVVLELAGFSGVDCWRGVVDFAGCSLRQDRQVGELVGDHELVGGMA